MPNGLSWLLLSLPSRKLPFLLTIPFVQVWALHGFQNAGRQWLPSVLSCDVDIIFVQGSLRWVCLCPSHLLAS